MNRKNNISVTTMVPTRRTYSTLIPKGRDGGFPRNVHDNYYDILELEASLILDKMKNMTPEEAAAAAAEAVAEAEVAIAQAEEAMLEAEAAEAEARAAVAALCTLKGRKTRDMKPWSKISGVRVGRVEPRSD